MDVPFPALIDVAAHNSLSPGWNGSWESRVSVNDHADTNVKAALQLDDADFRDLPGPGDPYKTRRQNLIKESILHECGHGMHLGHYFVSAYVYDSTTVLLDHGNVTFQSQLTYVTPDTHGEPWTAPRVDPDAMCSNAGISSANNPPAAGDKVVPDSLDETSLRQIRLQLKH